MAGLWLTSPAGWLPRAAISSGTLRSAIDYGLCLPFFRFLDGTVAWCCVAADGRLLVHGGAGAVCVPRCSCGRRAGVRGTVGQVRQSVRRCRRRHIQSVAGRFRWQTRGECLSHHVSASRRPHETLCFRGPIYKISPTTIYHKIILSFS